MHLILTHEHADFDAIASLMGASLLDNGAIPVLPRQINRNMRAFMMLYDNESSFIDPQDLSQRNIKSITLVDTQSLMAMRGVHEQTQIRVIDHHKCRDNLSPNWRITTDVCGANIT